MSDPDSDALRTTGLPPGWCRWLAGLDAGVAAALPLLVWLGIHSFLRGEHWWAKLSVFGALFFGPGVYTMGLGRATLAGACAALVAYALLGSLFGLVARPGGQIRNLLLATALVLVWQMLADSLIWPRLDVYAPAYLPPLATLPGHLIYALCLTRFPHRLRAVSRAFGDERAAAMYAPRAVSAPPAEPAPHPHAGAPAGSGAETERPMPLDAEVMLSAPETAQELQPPAPAGRDSPEPEGGERKLPPAAPST